MPPDDWRVPGSPSSPETDIAGYGPDQKPTLTPGSGPTVNPGHGDGKGDGSRQLSNPSTNPVGDLPTLASDLDRMTNDQSNPGRARHSVRGVQLAHITKFIDGHDAIVGVNKDPAPQVRERWHDVNNSVTDAISSLRELINFPNIKGEAADAIKKQAQTLIDSLTFVAGGAVRMHNIVDMFSQDVMRTREFFTQEGLYERVQYAMQNNEPSVVEWANNATMTVVRDQYNPPIYTVSQNHPDLPAAPTVPTDAGGPGVSDAPSGGGPTALPAGLLANGGGVPEEFRAKPDNTGNQGQNPADSAGGLDGLGDAAKGAGDAASKAADGAGKAATDALGKLLGDQKGSGLPDGVLGAVPAHANGLISPSGFNSAGGARGGGAGSMPGSAREVPTAKPAQTVSPTKATSPATPTSRAGLSNSGSSGGSGAPAAGHRGGAAEKEHKASKALRTDHGVISEGEAVVAVVGGEPTEQPAAPARST